MASFPSSWLHCGLRVYGNGSIGCTNNNYASREKCKKCGQPKEVAAMPAIAMPGASLPTYSHYFARAPGGLEQKMNIGFASNGALQQPLPFASTWSAGGPDKYEVQSASTWPLGGNQISGPPYANPINQPLTVPKGWRNGDWMCNCGFHNYSSRAQCKNCNASIPPALGTKRLASEDFTQDWENKRLNSGNNMQTNGGHQTYTGFNQMVGNTGDPRPGLYAPYPSVNSEQSNGVMEIGCVQIAIIIMHLDHNAIELGAEAEPSRSDKTITPAALSNADRMRIVAMVTVTIIHRGVGKMGMEMMRIL
ncbi:hypothetical protein GH714_034479 [Hevea brasiliensis]|uniref:RanBP2-type domain-containing protein n=1 Tax=Hevea brasiliensis TaxID=3981 RepID=A0A6A6MHH0_HEVBR|nr:hypothetical protein GH714_034479 [Hevea brasiliensis]